MKKCAASSNLISSTVKGKKFCKNENPKSCFSGSSSSSASGSEESGMTRSGHSLGRDNYVDCYGEYNYAYIIDNE